MGGGDLNLKKSWHPSTLRNIERVWKAEQKHEVEQQKIEQLQKELAAERSKEEIRNYAENQGVVRKRDERLDWMYQGPAAMVNREDYLMGRKIDKTFDILQKQEKGEPTEDAGEKMSASIFKPSTSTSNVTVDLANKIREDPLFAIMKREKEQRKTLLSNPVKMKQLQTILKQSLKKNKKGKKSKKSKHDAESSDSSSSDSNVDNRSSQKRKSVDKNEKHFKNYRYEEKNGNTKVSKRQFYIDRQDEEEEVNCDRKEHVRPNNDESYYDRRERVMHNNDRKNYDRRERVRPNNDERNYGGRKSVRSNEQDRREHFRSNKNERSYGRRDRDRSKEDERSYGRKECNRSDEDERSYGRKERNRSDEDERSYESHRGYRNENRDTMKKHVNYINGRNGHAAPATKKLSEEDKERMRQEMMSNAKWRDEQREKNVKRYIAEGEKDDHSGKGSASDFIRPMLVKAAERGTVEDRVKQKIFTIQRNKSDMDKNFARR